MTRWNGSGRLHQLRDWRPKASMDIKLLGAKIWNLFIVHRWQPSVETFFFKTVHHFFTDFNDSTGSKGSICLWKLQANEALWMKPNLRNHVITKEDIPNDCCLLLPVPRTGCRFMNFWMNSTDRHLMLTFLSTFSISCRKVSCRNINAVDATTCYMKL